MRTGSLLAHLIPRIAAPEPAATESLVYILNSDPAVSTALVDALRPTGVAFDVGSAVAEERHADGSIPDVTIRDSAGGVRLLCELKFWAGLTRAQPMGYLRQLPANAPSALLFIVPFTRTGPVWDDLKSRCIDAHVELADEAKAHGVRWARVDGRVLALTTWKVLLGDLARAAKAAGRRDIEQDIVQLRGLTDHMRQGVHVPKVHKTKGHAFWIHIDGYDQENGDDCGFIYENVHGKWIADDVLMSHLPELEGMVAGSSTEAMRTIRNEVRRKAELERASDA